MAEVGPETDRIILPSMNVIKVIDTIRDAPCKNSYGMLDVDERGVVLESLDNDLLMRAYQP